MVDVNDPEIQPLKNALVNFVTQKVFLLPDKWSGIVLSGGSEANEIALLLAKRKTKRNIVITTNLGHSSIANAAIKLGLKIITVDVDPKNFQASIKKVRQVLSANKEKIAPEAPSAAS